MGWVGNASLRSIYPLGMTRYALCRRLGGPQVLCGRVRKISVPPGFDPRTLKPVASRHTECNIPAYNFGESVCLILIHCNSHFILSAYHQSQ
jgi:hypothetical protein